MRKKRDVQKSTSPNSLAPHCQIGPENFDIEKWQIEKGPFYKMGPISGTTYDFKKFNTSFYRWNNGLPDATLKF